MNPLSGYVQIAIFAAAAAGGAGIGYWAEHKNRVAEVSTLKTQHAETLQTIQGLTQKASEAYRTLEKKWNGRQNENSTLTAHEVSALQRDLGDARDAGQRLRDELTTYRRTPARCSAGAGPAAPVASQPGADPIGVLAELYEQSDRRTEEVSKYADALKIAGGSCERDYDALK